MEQLYERLKKARERMGITLGQVADYLGMTQNEVSAVEAGKRLLTVEQLEKLECLYCCRFTLDGQDSAEMHRHFQINPADLSAGEIEAVAEIGRIVLNSRFMAEKLG